MRAGRVLSRRRPSTPSSAKRSCQRQTAVLLLAVRRMIAAVPSPSAVVSTIAARQTRFCVRHDGFEPVAVCGGYVDDDPCARIAHLASSSRPVQPRDPVLSFGGNSLTLADRLGCRVV